MANRADPAAPSEPVAETVYYADGKVKFTGFYRDGEMHGDWEWLRTDGTRMRTGSFDRGRQVGVWRTYDRGGVVVKETRFSSE